jgi:hypothetical protein
LTTHEKLDQPRPVAEVRSEVDDRIIAVWFETSIEPKKKIRTM